MLAVANQEDCTVGFHDSATGARLDVVHVPPQPHELCFDPVRRLLYVSHTYRSGWYVENTGRRSIVSVLDADRHAVVDVIELGPEHGPHDLLFDAARDLLYVSAEENGSGSGAVLVVDPDRRAVTGRIAVDAHGPHWFALTPDGAKCYTSNKEAPFVSVVDVPARRLIGKIPMPGGEGIAMAPDGRHAFVAAPATLPGAPEGEPGIRVIDTATDAVVRTIPTEHRLAALHVTASGKLLAAEARGEVVNGGIVLRDGDLRVYSAGTFDELGRIGIGKVPLTVRSSPDGAIGYVANSGSGTVSVVDLEACRLVTTFPAGSGAHGLALVGAAT